MKRWRYLEADSVDAAAGLAEDEAIMLRHGRGETSSTEATLRLYTYRPHCALVGRYQSLEDEVDVAFCRRSDVQIGRRPTGGGAIIMGPGQLGVAITAPARPEETPRRALRRYSEGVVAGLRRLGIEAAFRSKNDLEVADRKIAGLGLYLDPEGAILFHSSVLVDLSVPLMLSVLRIPGAKLSDKAVARVEERVTTVSRELGSELSAAEIRREFALGLATALESDLENGELDPGERSRFEELKRDRYGDREWVFQRSSRRDARGSSLMKTPEGLVRFFVGVTAGTIKSVLVTGDFNTLPPGVAKLESALRWCRADHRSIAEVTSGALSSEDLGAPPERIAAAIWEAASVAMRLDRAGHPDRIEGSCYFPEPYVEERN